LRAIEFTQVTTICELRSCPMRSQPRAQAAWAASPARARNDLWREAFRHHSFVSEAARGVICGLGPRGYLLALDALADIIAAKKDA